MAHFECELANGMVERGVELLRQSELSEFESEVLESILDSGDDILEAIESELVV